MPKPLSRSLSRGSSDLFEPDDPDFLQTLLHMKLPGDVLTPPPRVVSPPCEVSESERVVDNPDARNTRKRPRSTSPCNPDEIDTQELEYDLSEADSDTYGASRFGGFGEYMRRKRAKLQIQNTQMALTDTMPTSASTIFRGLAIYVSVIHFPPIRKIRSSFPDQRLDRPLRSGPTTVDSPTRWYIPRLSRQEVTRVRTSLALPPTNVLKSSVSAHTSSPVR